MKKFLLLLTLLLTTAVGWAGTVVETLNRADAKTEDTATSGYLNYQITTQNGAEYIFRANSTKTNFQMKNEGGFAVTKSIGKIAKISFTVSHGKKDEQTLDIYASNEATSAIVGLNISSTNLGTKVKTLTVPVKNTENPVYNYEVTFDSEYQYFGFIIPNTSTFYFTKIEVTWETDGEGGGENPDTPTEPEVINGWKYELVKNAEGLDPDGEYIIACAVSNKAMGSGIDKIQSMSKSATA